MSNRRSTPSAPLELVPELQGAVDREFGKESYIQWLDWLARRDLLATLETELARVGSNHHFWIQSPASCH